MNKMNKSVLSAAVALALGVSAMPQTASAESIEMNWSGYFRMLDPNGAALASASISSTLNQYETPINGTMTFDPWTGVGSGTIAPFSFLHTVESFSNTSFSLQAIGNGNCTTSGCGAGPLVLANMLTGWGSSSYVNNGIPISVVLDASGMFANFPAVYASGYGAGIVINQASPGGTVGAADGTYVGGAGTHITSGYLNLGAVPISTTKFNTAPLCTPGGGNTGPCINVSPSGGLPLVVDTATNANDYVPPFMGGTYQSDPGIGGSPMLAGPFQGFNANFDITTLTVVGCGTPETGCPAPPLNNTFPVPASLFVPLPAAAWLFGSGLLGLIGVARRKAA